MVQFEQFLTEENKLGKGAFGKVYKVKDSLAIKI